MAYSESNCLIKIVKILTDMKKSVFNFFQNLCTKRSSSQVMAELGYRIEIFGLKLVWNLPFSTNSSKVTQDSTRSDTIKAEKPIVIVFIQ